MFYLSDFEELSGGYVSFGGNPKGGSGLTWLFDIDTLTMTMNYQPVNADAAFDEKEHEYKGKKPESEVNISPSSSAQSKKHDDKTKSEAKARVLINEVNAIGTLVPTVRQISPNSTNTFSAVGPSNADASPTHRKSSCIDTSQLPDDPDMP
nr:hypothetical protein [Tanacetum cinerariifolium]